MLRSFLDCLYHYFVYADLVDCCNRIREHLRSDVLCVRIAHLHTVLPALALRLVVDHMTETITAEGQQQK